MKIGKIVKGTSKGCDRTLQGKMQGHLLSLMRFALYELHIDVLAIPNSLVSFGLTKKALSLCYPNIRHFSFFC